MKSLLMLAILSLMVVGGMVTVADADADTHEGTVTGNWTSTRAMAPSSVPDVIPVAAETTEAAAKTTDEDPVELGSELWTALKQHKWGAAVGLALMLLIAGLRAFGKKIPGVGGWLGTRRGGYVLAFVTASGAMLGATMAAGESLSWALAGNVLSAGFAAIGIYHAAKDAAATMKKS